LTAAHTGAALACAFEEGRQMVASLLAILAGQGRQALDEQFFKRCVSDAAHAPNLHDTRIQDMADYMSTLVFAETD